MGRKAILAAVLGIALGAIVFADEPRKKDVVEPPAPEPKKPKVEPPKAVKEAPPPQKPKVEPAKSAKPIDPRPAEKPRVEPAKPAKLTRSPFSDPALDKVAANRKKDEKKPNEKVVMRKPAEEKPRKKSSQPGSYVHAVTIPLKKDAPSDTAEKMVADCQALLARIPTVRSIKAGPPAEKDSKDYVKKDYSVGLLVLVDDHDALMAYLKHPLHVQFVEKYKKHIDFDHLRVVDFADVK